ncbi:MAG TPA: DNA repair protein RecO [Rhizomicrobium sp.]|jgi:DNA repair protein RecO (recombination protein O)|nr:DNA repair protein RecO [Rhizomicrobium sp.]
MEWADEAIVLSVRPYGETSAIVEALTHLHGRHLGLVHGGASRKVRAMLQPGNSLHITWRARLNEHLGSFHAEPLRVRAGAVLERRDALIGLNAFAAMAGAVLPEREAHVGVYGAAEVLLDAIAERDFTAWAPLYIRWEAGLLEELGFGLDLARCAATGSTDDLIYVSPRSGRAVSREAGEPYADRLLKLPVFLLGSQNAGPSVSEMLEGLKLTAYFLLERVLQPHGKDLPQARIRLQELAARESM